MKEGKSNYLQIVTYSGHNPFILPDNLKRIHFKGDYPEKMRDFMIMANYTDHGLGILLDYLKSRPDYKDMMIVMIGDHEASCCRPQTDMRIASRQRHRKRQAVYSFHSCKRSRGWYI